MLLSARFLGLAKVLALLIRWLKRVSRGSRGFWEGAGKEGFVSVWTCFSIAIQLERGYIPIRTDYDLKIDSHREFRGVQAGGGSTTFLEFP